MPRVVELTVPPERTDEALQRLTGEQGVLSVRVLRGVSVQPPATSSRWRSSTGTWPA